MIGSIYVGLSGLSAYSSGLRAISGNVANLNAPGFKSVAFRFSSVGSQSDLLDARRFGGLDKGSYGVRIGESRIDFSQGDLRASNGDFDLAINGEGFLVLLDGNDRYFARTGEFVLNGEGYLVERASGYRLGVLDGSGKPAFVNLEALRSNPAEGTSRIEFAGNLSASGEQASVNDITMFGPDGEPLSWTIAFDRTEPASDNEWAVTVTDSAGEEIGSSSLRFENGSVDPATAQLTIADSERDFSVVLDFSEGVTSFSSGSISTIRASDVDGRAEGALTSISVDETGAIALTYSNGESETLGKVALADFRDLQRLKQIAEGLFDAPDGTDFRLSSSGQDGFGRLVSGQIEASNVDLSQEFGDLILVQRGFQASSQVISVTNEMIEQLFGLRGQG